MRWAFLWLSLFHLDSISTSYPAPRCSQSQRYDVHKFPPRCLDCPKTIPISMKLYSFGVKVRQRAAKFSPGLPHNQTCGCWRARNQTDVALSLNSSRIVAGMSFQSTRNQWLKRFSVAASEDNVTFLEWGTYTQRNTTESAMVLFRYPIRATFFRLTVHEYVNHMVNETTGFPLSVNALVSDSEPFGCECASLPTGECCPSANMEVKNGVCVLCMDPLNINTVMVDGCGRCKPGTMPRGLQCVPMLPIQTQVPFLNVSSAVSSGDEWVTHVNTESGDHSLVLFLTPGGDVPCVPPSATSECFAALMRDFTPVLWDLNLTDSSGLLPVSKITREINPQYVQFDRGRGVVMTMDEETIRSWARCDGSQCTGNLVGLFVSLFDNTPRFTVRVVRQPLVFDLAPSIIQSLVFGFSRGLSPVTIEIHHMLDSDQYVLWPLSLNASAVQWDDSVELVPVKKNGELTQPPPAAWFSMRIFAGDKQFSVSTPVPIVKKHSFLSSGTVKDTVKVDISYGLGLKTTPEPGDSEQLVTIRAFSKQPIRLARLSSVSAGVTTVYTSSKGFIVDSARALDLGVACNGMMTTNALIGWLGSALGLMDHRVESFVNQTCTRSSGASKLYWLVPYRSMGTRRNEMVEIKVSADFL